MQGNAWQKNGHSSQWQMLDSATVWDVLVVGGGITGAGVAREAARLGLKVLLVERQDFAWGTSSRSSKMVHGGLRYMAQGDIKTTRHSVQERERLLKEAPGLVDLMHYAMPHYRKQFPSAFLFHALLFFYDLFAHKSYRKYFSARAYLEKMPLLRAQQLTGVSQFADAVTDDSRLVLRVLHEAIADGACCLNYVGVTQLIKTDGQVTGAQVRNEINGEKRTLAAKVVINATGAWADQLRAQVGGEKKIRPARGSHIVIPAERLPVQEAFTLLHPKDQRPIFVYPWLNRTVIGTTDLDNGVVENVEAHMSQAELEYLLDLVACYFPKADIRKEHILSSFAGVRPLIASGARNPSKEKRDHSIWQEQGLYSVSGGKLTTFRLIALDVLSAAKANFMNRPKAKHSEAIFRQATTLPEGIAQLSVSVQKRLLGYYGADLFELLSQAKKGDLDCIADTPFIWAELRFSAAHEAVQHLDDLLLRRTRLGLLLKDGGIAHMERIKALCMEELGWTETVFQQELSRYQDIIKRSYAV